MQKTACRLKAFNTFVAKEPETNKALIEKMLDKGATAVNFTEQSLNAFQIVDSVFDGNPAFNKKIFALQSNGYRSFSDLGTYVLESPVQNKAEVESMIMAGATPAELARRLRALDELREAFGKDSADFQYLLQAEKSGLDLSQLANFVDGIPSTQSVSKLIADGATVDQLAVTRQFGLESLERIVKHFKSTNRGYILDPTFIGKAISLEASGLQLSDLAEYLTWNQSDPQRN